MSKTAGLAASLPLRGELRHAEVLARHTSWRVGGPAQRSYRPADLDDLCTFLARLSAGALPCLLSASAASEPLFWLGLGSNLLIRDGGIKGTVIMTHAGLGALTLQEDGTVRAEAGVPCARVAKYCARHDLVGAEFLGGIPGTMGGALAMNAGAWGSETWDWVTLVETVDRYGRLRLREPEEYLIGYRQCRLQRSVQDVDEWFVAAHLWLQPGDGAAAERRIRELLERRNLTQPTGTANCGSVFRNPADGFAARLIEAAGLKGFTVGGACVSSKHANFIVNDGRASAADIETLIGCVGNAVERHSGVRLRPEVRIVGEVGKQ